MMQIQDAEIISIEVDRLKCWARLKLLQTNNQIINVEFIGLKYFRAEDFTMQNVVYEFMQYSQFKFPDDKVEYWLDWVTSLSDRGSWLDDKKKKAYFDACKKLELELVIILPSAGAQIGALCEKITLELLPHGN